jgi:cbb3-type cytochrome oxidase cytochrome c subunit
MPAIMAVALAFLLACSWSGVQDQDPRGADLAGRLGCFACHSRQEGSRAAPLDGVGARLTPRELQLAITFPRHRHPKAKMPSYAYLPRVEQEALVNFLKTLH